MPKSKFRLVNETGNPNDYHLLDETGRDYIKELPFVSMNLGFDANVGIPILVLVCAVSGMPSDIVLPDNVQVELNCTGAES